MSLTAIEIFGSSYGFLRILAEFAVTHIRESAKLFTMIYPRELQRTPEQ